MGFAYLPVLLFVFGQGAPQQVHFTGRTTADATLIRDALQNVVRYGDALQQCTTLSAVEARVLPADYRPRDSRYHIAGAEVRYEHWDAVLCGRPTAFLVGFWSAPQGGTMFQVSYPLPDDVPSEPRR